MAIFVTGDTHGAQRHGINSVDGFMNRLSTDSFPEQKGMNKNDYVIICGDFGGIWATDQENASETEEEKYSLDWLDKKPFTTLFIPGNHENYDRLMGNTDKRLLSCWLYKRLTEKGLDQLINGYPQADWHGGKIRCIRDSVMMLEPGYIFDINGRSCFAFGGARSHDIRDGILEPWNYKDSQEFNAEYRHWWQERRSFRVFGTSWWPQEMPDQETMKRGLKEAERAKSVDFVFTHDAPASDKIYLGYSDIDELNRYFERVISVMSYRKWFCGHLHDNRNLPGDKILLYEQIIQID